jgi:RecJ-like exonuclease
MIFEGVRAFDGAVRLEALDYLVLEGLAPLSGKLAGIFANAGFSGHDRPIFTLNPEERWIKVSARMNPQLVDRGLHLGKALDSVAARLEGSGGGHAVAAGARVPRQSMEEFVRELDKEVQLQLADEEA